MRSGPRQRLKELDAHPYAGSVGSARLARILALRIRRSGNVEMCPRWTIDELLEEDGRADCSSPASTRIFHVRPFASDQILVVVPGGKSPHALADTFPRFNQHPGQLITVR